MGTKRQTFEVSAGHRIRALILAACMCLGAGVAIAHHSFAVYDFDTEVTFKGVVETLNFKNPHIAMTLMYEDETGEKKVVDFVEGAPANMMIRNGFNPEWIQPGKTITAIGSPRHDDPNKMFLKSLILEDGTEYRSVGP